jgi:acetyl-CoA carboxylase biotin carboxyl carrier protein
MLYCLAMSEAPLSREGASITFDLDTVREVAALLRESQLGEICIETTSEDAPPARLMLRRAATLLVPTVADAEAPATPDSQSDTSAPASDSTPTMTTTEVTSPAVGIFHPAKTPIAEGEAIKAGQVIGLVESMRVPNEVTAPKAGRIRDIRVGDGQGVEFGQVLFVIEEAL